MFFLLTSCQFIVMVDAGLFVKLIELMLFNSDTIDQQNGHAETYESFHSHQQYFFIITQQERGKKKSTNYMRITAYKEGTSIFTLNQSNVREFNITLSLFQDSSSHKHRIQQLKQNKLTSLIFYIKLHTKYINLQTIQELQTMKKVAYLYNDAITNYHFSKQHPMKTKRIKMTHSLIQSYNLCPYLNMFQSRQASKHELQSFHDPEYVKYLETWITGKKEEVVSLMKQEERRKIREDTKLKALFKVNQSFDCPGFDGLYNFCQLAVGGSIDAADTIVTGLSDIVVNWSGGYHHAKKTEASGFCYVNDIVICILELLRMYPRVLYLDIDVHHGDGVQQAFYNTNRVMTVSFHEFDEDFFPGTGALDSVGQGAGKYFSVNVPLRKGMRDFQYIELFKKVMDKVMGSYRPDACVIQCGADSLAKDRLGHQNLSIKGHAACVKHMMGYGTPIVFLGGGGYTIENVSRCWAYETSVILGQPIQDEKIPQKDPFVNLYQQDQYSLHFDIESRQNQNDRAYLENIYQQITQNMRESEIRPSIAFHNAPKRFIPEENFNWEAIDQEENSDNDTLCEELFNKK